MPGQLWLFSYGTLRQRDVQMQVFGRVVEAVEDALAGFVVERLRITDPSVIALSGSAEHSILRRRSGGEPIKGSALVVTEEDLRSADAYEVAEYVRVPVELASGRSAFAYVHRAHEPDGAAGED